ncbi:MAG: sigma-54 dependent transcriptional regulator [Xylophilus ampelinus]
MSRPFGKSELVYQSLLMRNLLRQVEAFADCDHPVLIQGETGVGKEHLAALIHQGHSRYGRGPFVPVNCGAVPDGLFESLFFGHSRGAFTGAVQAHKGFFERAQEGTLFLDEVGELPLYQQVRLLRVLEDGVITRVGSETPQRTDFRLVAATNRNLVDMVRLGSFRADLYYRIAVIELHVPSLQERGVEERLAIFRSVLVRVLQQPPQARVPLDPPAWLLDRVALMQFPGNIRQLRNLAERIGVITRQMGEWQQTMIENVLALSESMSGPAPGAAPAVRTPGPMVPVAGRRARMGTEERQRIVEALDAHDWRRQEAASQLGISRKTLWEKMRRYGIGESTGAEPGGAGYRGAPGDAGPAGEGTGERRGAS